MKSFRSYWFFAAAAFIALAADTTILSLREGLLLTALRSAQPRTLHIASRQGTLPTSFVEQLTAANGIHAHERDLSISAEIITSLPFKRPDHSLRDVIVRGVDALALGIHGVKLQQGSIPMTGQAGVILGRRQVGRFIGFTVGQTVWIGNERWPVIGIIDAHGSVFDSEVWCDRQALGRTLHSDEISSVSIKLADGVSEGTVISAVSQIGAPGLEVEIEHSYYARATDWLIPLWNRGAWIVVLGYIVATVLVGSFAPLNSSTEWRGIRDLLKVGAIGASTGFFAAALFQEHEAVLSEVSLRYNPIISRSVGVLIVGLIVLLLVSVLMISLIASLLRHTPRAYTAMLRLSTFAVLASSAVVVTIYVAYGRTLVGAYRSLAYKPGVALMSKRLFAGDLPFAYVERIKQVVHGQWPVNWFRNVPANADTWKQSRPVMAVSDGIFDVFGPDQTRPPPDQCDAWKAHRDGLILIGRLKIESGWRIGDHVALRIDDVPVSAIVSGSAGGQEGGFAPDKVLMHYDYVDDHLQRNKGRVAMIGILCRSEDEIPLVDELEALFEKSSEPVTGLRQWGVLDYDLAPSSLLPIVDASIVPSVMLLFFLSFSLITSSLNTRGAPSLPLLGCAAGMGALVAYLFWQHDGMRFGSWVLENVIVTRPMAAMGFVVALVLSATCRAVTTWICRTK